MERRIKIIVAAAATIALAGAAGTGVAMAGGGDDDGDETPITGTDLDKASAAALEHTGGGEVTETESGDEESRYEVEVTLEDGTQVDVQLDGNFEVVGEENDGQGEDEENEG